MIFDLTINIILSHGEAAQTHYSLQLVIGGHKGNRHGVYGGSTDIPFPSDIPQLIPWESLTFQGLKENTILPTSSEATLGD